MTVRIGLIGAGRIGAMHAAHLAALRGPGGEPAVRLSIVDAVPEQAAAVAGRTGAVRSPRSSRCSRTGWTASSWRPARPRTRS